MRITHALGSGLFLVIIAHLMPVVFRELSTTIVVLLKGAQRALVAAGMLASHAGAVLH